MIKEWVDAVKNNFEQRLSNPVLGAFTVSWTLFNWKLLVYLATSDARVEDKIAYIDSNYSNIHSFFTFPAVSAIFITLILPWISFTIQSLQEFVNKKRAIKQFEYDAELLESKERLVITQVKLEEIREKSKMEIDFTRKKYELEIETKKRHSEHELSKESRSIEFDFNERLQKTQFEKEREKRDMELHLEERKVRQQFEMEREKSDLVLQQEERKLRQQFDMERQKNDMEMEKKDRERLHEIELRKLETLTQHPNS